MRESTARPFRVAVHGLPHFCQRLTQLLHGDKWDVPYHSPFSPWGLAARFNDLARCDLAYSWTGRIKMGKFLRAARALGKTKIILLWCGSDVLFAKEEFIRGEMDSWVVDRIHWAVSPWLAEEVRALGVNCEYVQVSFVDAISPVPLPEKFSVLVYAPSVKTADLYGVDLILEVARQLPSIEFRLVGLQEESLPGCPANVRVYGHVELADFYREATVLWRPVRHDGLSFMVLEALAHGRHVLYSYPLPGCQQVTTAAAACKELTRLRDLHAAGCLDLNEKGRELIAHHYNPQTVRESILRRWQEIILSPGTDFGHSRIPAAF